MSADLASRTYCNLETPAQRRRVWTMISIVVAAFAISAPSMALSVTRSVSGTVACQNGGTVNGIWVQSSAGGSRWASFTRRSSAAWLADYSASVTTAASSTNVELQVGCGGTTSSWGSNNKTTALTVTGSRGISARCNDSTGANGYRCRFWPSKTALIGMPFTGGFDLFGLAPATSHHTSGDVSTDLYAASGTSVTARAYAPKGVTLTMKTSGSPVSTCGRGENVRVTLYWNGENIGWFQYGHLRAIPTAVRTSGTTLAFASAIGQAYFWSYSAGCWEVNTSSGVHTHYTGYNVKNYACVAPYSKKTISAGRWIGLVGLNGASSVKQYCPA